MVPLFNSRGFSSQGSFDSLHPLPEKPEESLPLSYLETVREAINSYRTPDTSGCSSPTTDNTGSFNNSLSASQTWSTNTGNLTGRSSVYSWGNDDVCRPEAKAQVLEYSCFLVVVEALRVNLKLYRKVLQSHIHHHCWLYL